MRAPLFLGGCFVGLLLVGFVLAVRGAERWSERAWGRDE